ncbi:MAG: DUF559 domain-containing protein [Sphingomonas sp.]|nr:DUF559 domain-containing protein [Sphingomonas sp.]
MATIGQTSPHAQRLRRDSTDAENRLWRHLRNRNLGGFKFRRQVTIGEYVADFACVECRVVVEADGGHHSEERDAARTNRLSALGWRVIRFWNTEILRQTEGVLAAILTACHERQKAEPSPYPLPLAGEGK